MTNEKPSRRRRTRKTGLPPGTLVHIGERRDFEPRITVFHYDADSLRELVIEKPEDCFEFGTHQGIVWINIDGIHKIDLVEKIGKHFNLHPLTMEDIVNNEQRPKMEEHDHYLYVVLKMLHAHSAAPSTNLFKDKVLVEQVSIVLGHNYVISFQESIAGDVFDTIRERLRNNHGRIRKVGADYLAYSLMDAIVDHYFVLLEKAGEKLTILEEELLTDIRPQTLHTLQILKRDMIDLRRAIWPLREVISALQRTDNPLIEDNTKKFLRDVYDHTIHVIDSIEANRDLLGGMMEIYLSSINNQLNSVMKVLTMISTIFIPLNFIVGVYGMNFKHMPELEWEHGYLYTWAILILVVAAMMLFFKRKRWW
jgi:magnesium transporter